MYQEKREELLAHKGCLLWGSRVIIPPSLRDLVMATLHEVHPGVVHMKALAQSYVWWSGINKLIEDWVKQCETCQETWPAPPKAPSNNWESAQTPWSWVHVEFEKPFQGHTFLVTVDSYSK